MNRYTRPVEKFLRWWLDELAGMVPAQVRRFCSPRTRGWTVTLDGENVQLLRRGLSGETEVALPAPASRQARIRTSRVRLRLPTRHILHTYVSLPAAAEENLGEVLRFELDRRTPFTADEVHLAHRIESRDDKANAIKVALTLVPRAVVAEAVGTLDRFGLAADRLEIPRADGSADELLLSDEKTGLAKHLGTPVRAAIAVAFLSSAVAAYASSGRNTDEIDALSRSVDSLRVHVQKADALKSEIAALEDEETAAADAGRVRPNELLAELTRVLPDDTWLERLHLAGGKLTLTGFSDSSSAVIRLLNEAPYFAAPSFAAPVTQDAESGKEQFTLTATVRRPKP